MKKWLISVFITTLFLVHISPSAVMANEWELIDEPIREFNCYSSVIKLKAINRFYESDYDPNNQYLKIAYIINIQSALSEVGGTVCLKLLDKEGFEITRKVIFRVVKNYTGTLTGSFALKPKEYQNLSSVDFAFYVDKQVEQTKYK